MTRDARQPDGLPVPGSPYSPLIVAGGSVWISGQVGVADGRIADGIEAQTRISLEHIAVALEAAGLSMDDVVKVSAYLADLRDFEAFNGEYRRHFSEPYPARTTIGASLAPGLLVEIDAVAQRQSP
jgi:2-iminobutanoate/2-iminopropanoate deaminase